MNTSLTTLQKNFVDLMLDDKMYTNKEMAELLECDERTVYKMKQNPKVTAEIESRADSNLKADLNKAYNVLTDILFSKKANDHVKIKALDLYLKTQGKLKEKGEQEVNLKVSSVEEAEAELDKLLDM